MGSTLARALALLVVGGGLGFVVNAVRPGGLSAAAYAPPTQCSGAEAVPVPATMTPAAAAALCGQPGVVVADARSASAYAEGHVADAVHLPCNANGEAAGAALPRFAHARTIVVYGDSTAEAQPVALSLQRHYPTTHVAVLAGGFPAWSTAGLACASGPCEDCKTARAAGDHR